MIFLYKKQKTKRVFSLFSSPGSQLPQFRPPARPIYLSRIFGSPHLPAVCQPFPFPLYHAPDTFTLTLAHHTPRRGPSHASPLSRACSSTQPPLPCMSAYPSLRARYPDCDLLFSPVTCPFTRSIATRIYRSPHLHIHLLSLRCPSSYPIATHIHTISFSLHIHNTPLASSLLRPY